jgi:hypothetical protein
VLAWGIASARKQRRAALHPLAARLGALAAGAPACGAFAAARRRPHAGLPVGLRSASQPVRLRAATAAPTAKRRAPTAKRRLSRRVHRAACVSRRLPPSAWSLAGGQAPRDPPPPCGRRTATPGASAPGVAPHPGHPTRAWLQPRPGALTPRHHERGVPPAWGPSCDRPQRRGWRRVRSWPRLRPVAVAPP